MTYDVKHFFIYLFSICISSLVRCLLRSLAHFVIGLFVFLLLNFQNSLYILDNSFFPTYICFANIFSPSVACLFILLPMSYTEQNILTLMKSSLSILFFTPLVFYLKSHHQTQGHLDFLLCYLLGVL